MDEFNEPNEPNDNPPPIPDHFLELREFLDNLSDYESSDDDDELYFQDARDVEMMDTDSDDGEMLPAPTAMEVVERERFVLNDYLAESSNKTIYKLQPYRLMRCNYKKKEGLGLIPHARSGHRIIASESNLFSLGGYHPPPINDEWERRPGACALFQELWCYNFATNAWKLLLSTENSKNIPKELASNALIMHNNVLISHGGTGYPFGNTCSNDCHVYTTGSKPFVTTLRVTGELPAAQYGTGIVIHKNYLYTIGGTTGFDYSCDVYRLNLITKEWENVYICRPEMRDDPEGRYRHEVVYDGKHIYVLGGGTTQTVYDLQRLPAFNLKTNKWDYIETLPDPSIVKQTINQEAINDGYPKARKCFTCVQHTTNNGDIEAFITGGLQGDFITYFADIWKINLRTKQWICIKTARLPKPLYFHTAAQAGNGCMYIFGGIEYSHKEMRRCNDLYKIWMTIPKLSEICWDALTYYNENLHRYSRDSLAKAGIPERFIQRLPIEEKQQQQDNNTKYNSSIQNAQLRTVNTIL